MAEAIGAVSGVAALATFALHAATRLHNTIESYRSHQQRVLDLLEENGALNSVLVSLNRTIASATDLDLSALEIPLARCGKACDEFNQEIEKVSSPPGTGRASFRGWARLRYMGEDIDGFRRLLAGYKTTINIAIADATLQRSTLTAERIEGYSQIIQTATADFEDRLQRIDDCLETLVNKGAAGAGPEAEAVAVEVQQIQEERLGTEKCLQICTQLSEHIAQIRLAGLSGSASSSSSRLDTAPERITNEGLDECEDSLSRMANRLACHEKALFTRLASMVKGSGMADGSAGEIARLREEWESTHRQMEILSKAGRKLEETVSVIRNHATGNAIQVMVSVDGKPIHGTNEGTGEWTRQVGGYMSNETVQEIMRGMVQMTVATREGEKASVSKKAEVKKAARMDGESEESGEDSKFEDLYGEGFTLECESPTAAGGRR